ANKRPLLLHLIEILQIRRRLVLAHWHDGAVGAEEIDLLADGDVRLTLIAIVVRPPDLIATSESFEYRPRPRERIVNRGHLDAQDTRFALSDGDPLLDDGLAVVGHRHAGLVPHVRRAHMARFSFERVVAAIAIGIEPLADRVSLKPGLLGNRPGAP